MIITDIIKIIYTDLRNIRRNALDKDLPRSNSASEGTVETIVTMSPSDPPVISDPTCKLAVTFDFHQ